MLVDLEVFHERVKVLLTGNLPPIEERYQAFSSVDPYPEIEPALLHAGHIASYAIMVGMIEPFDLNALTKPATYLAQLEGPVRYRDENGDVCKFFLTNNSQAEAGDDEIRHSIRLRPNSLCYVTLKPHFRFPNYIAGRFNLLIRDVYRGLLVGTGPLVDPGFQGRLSIPLHNFTNNEYELEADDGFVYFEFTKLSRPQPPNNTCTETLAQTPNQPGWLAPAINDYPPFPASKKKRRSIDDYLKGSTGTGPAQSALAGELAKVTESNDKLSLRADLVTAAGAVGLLALLFTAWDVYSGAQQVSADAQTELRTTIQTLSGNVSELQIEFAKLQQQSASEGALSRESSSVTTPLPLSFTTSSIKCGNAVYRVSTGTSGGICSMTGPANSIADGVKCTDNGNLASATCATGCSESTGSGSCLIHE
jgi:deoxycytidine triphosphate deaminase